MAIASRFSPATGVVVTGGASGIGRATAEALAEAGRPVAIWDLDGETCRAAAAELAFRYDVVTIGVACDLREVGNIAPALEQTRGRLPTLGGLVHAAGVFGAAALEDLTQAGWDGVFAVNLRVFPFLVQAMLSDLRSNKGSAVVAIASAHAHLGNRMIPAYGASSGGLIALVRALAEGLSPDGIRINAVSPGPIDTPMLAPALAATPGFYEGRTLLGRLGEPDEVARVVRFLMSDEASFMTAAEVQVDGGMIHGQRHG